jgi:hypothetical protein
MNTSSASVLSLQATIEKLLRATGRENVNQLLALMRDHGFYRVRCYKHHRYQGGLAQHSLEVLLRMQRQNEGILPTDSIIIVALLHDLCKIDGFSHIRHHGYRSVILATREAGLKLRPEEFQAILWHMHGPKEKGKLGASFDAVLDSALWKELRKADHYSASHPLSREEIIYAMEGKHRRVVAIREDKCVGSEDYKSAPRPKDESPQIRSKEDKRRMAIKRNNATIADIFEALHNGEISVNEAYDWYKQQENDPAAKAINNTFFCTSYLNEHPDKIDLHRTELADRCLHPYGAAKRVARYIYEETEHVFNWDKWKTDDIYEWLKAEFAFPSKKDNFYKACESFDNYNTRK